MMWRICAILIPFSNPQLFQCSQLFPVPPIVTPSVPMVSLNSEVHSLFRFLSGMPAKKTLKHSCIISLVTSKKWGYRKQKGLLQKPRWTGYYLTVFLVDAVKMDDAWNFLANFQDFVCWLIFMFNVTVVL